VDDALARHAPANARRGLDAGSAVGGFTRALAARVEQAVGVDLAFDLVRAAARRPPAPAAGDAAPARPAPFFAVATVEEPPFERGAFDVVLALNIVDAVARPRVAIRRLDACLRPGGLLLLATPLAWSSARTVLDERIAEEDLLPFLRGAGRGTLQPGYDLLEDRPRVPWLLPLGPRRYDLFMTRCIAARKRERPQR
jgi:SAM-dependent methyltransferase